MIERTIPELEQILCASILEHPKEPWGPNVCTAMAYHPDEWCSAEAIMVASAIKECFRYPCRWAVGQHIDKRWLSNPAFSPDNASPMICVEWEAFKLVKYYDRQVKIREARIALQELEAA